MNLRLTSLVCGLAVLCGCAEEVPPPSVHDYLADPIALEAAVVRCAANRSETRYDAECVNARQAVSIIEARKERERREAFEAESAAKRAALRRTQQAAAEARRRAEEAEQRRREAAYLAQFGELPPAGDDEAVEDETAVNAPGAVLPPAPEEPSTPPARVAPTAPPQEAPAVDGGNAPVVDTEPPADLDAVREELRRRNEESGN
ncbi:MAG: EexN family lipoprotein [Woeseiaceae bacterium]|nr:EexN family lipoprotein [Woeseiaceae bacterium]